MAALLQLPLVIMRPERRPTQTTASKRFALRSSPQPTAADIPDSYEFAPGVGLTQVPVLQLTKAQLSRLPMDPATRTLVSFVDGETSFVTLLSASDIPVLDALLACRRLLQHGSLAVRAE